MTPADFQRSITPYQHRIGEKVGSDNFKYNFQVCYGERGRKGGFERKKHGGGGGYFLPGTWTFLFRGTPVPAGAAHGADLCQRIPHLAVIVSTIAFVSPFRWVLCPF